MTFVLARPTSAVIFDEPTEYVDRTLATASWWDKYEIQPGVYPLEWVDIDYRPWNPNPEARSPGFIANVGPYYALVVLKARLLEEYRVNRLFTASSVDHKLHDESPVVTLTRSVYAYQVPGCPKGQHGRPLTSYLGGRVVDVEFHQRAMAAL